jgi:iron complex outermembrane receptor protein
MRTRKLGLLVSTAMIGAIAAPAFAQTAPTTSTDKASSGVQDIIVTAQKRSQSLHDVGITVNVVGRAQLARQGVVTVADLSKAVPGFTVAANSDGTPIYTLRGVSFNSINLGTTPTVTVYIDEAPLPFSIMTEGALLDLEHVEVLKGPQGTLFGQNATGGAINYVAAKPTSSFEAGVTGTFSRFDTFDGQAYVSGPLTDTLKARLALGGTSSGPWQQSTSRDDTFGDQRKMTGRLLLDWRPTSRLHISTNVNGWLDRSDTQAPQFVTQRISIPAEAAPGLTSFAPTIQNARSADWNANTPFRRNNSFYQGILRADYELAKDITLTSLTDYSKVRIRSLTELDGTPLTIQTLRTTGNVSAINQEFRVTGAAPAAGLHYILGVNFQSDRSFEQQHFFIPLISSTRNVAGFGSFDSSIAEAHQTNKSYAMFANVDWDITDRLTLSGGLRKTWIDHKSVGCSRDDGNGMEAAVVNSLSQALRGAFGLPPGPTIGPGDCVTLGADFAIADPRQSLRETNLSWRANVSFKLNPDILLYATASRGFKGGNFPIAAAANYVSLLPVKQEELTAYEAGTKLRLFDRSLTINAAGYYYDYKNKQLLTNQIDPIFGLLFRVANIPKSSVRGFDVDATWAPTRNLTLRTAVTYADSKVGTYQGFDVFGNNVPLTGHPFNLAPKWISVSDAEYRHALSSKLDGFVGASLVYNSKTYSDLADSPTLEIRQFTTLDLRAGVTSKSGKWQAMVFGRNVTNVYHWNFAQAGGDSVLRYASQPATYGITVGLKY